MKGKGFSIIELLVVASITLVLTTLALVSYSSTSKRSRDSRRISDLKKVSLALEMFRQENGFYPDTGALGDLVTDYIEAVPSDPRTYSYYYSSATDYTYTLDGQMEDVGNATGTYGNNCGGVCNYRITNP